jgi:hypothetical protein
MVKIAHSQKVSRSEIATLTGQTYLDAMRTSYFAVQK